MLQLNWSDQPLLCSLSDFDLLWLLTSLPEWNTSSLFPKVVYCEMFNQAYIWKWHPCNDDSVGDSVNSVVCVFNHGDSYFKIVVKRREDLAIILVYFQKLDIEKWALFPVWIWSWICHLLRTLLHIWSKLWHYTWTWKALKTLQV